MHAPFVMIACGAVIVIADLVIWRTESTINSTARKIWRCGVFAVLTYLLFANGLSPFSIAPATAPFGKFAEQVLAILWWLQCALFLMLIVDILLLPKAWHVQRLFHDLAAGVIFIAATIAALAYVLELPISGLVATSGAVAVILGLAIQNTLNDVFSGIVLNTTEPFRMGDSINVGGLEGKVIENNWRATKLLNGVGNLVVVPNSVAAKSVIVNLSEPPNTHGIVVELKVSPEVRPAVVIEALERAAASTLDVLAAPASLASVKAFETNSINYELTCYVDSLSKKTAVKNQLYDLVHRHLSSAGVSLHPLEVPFATRVHVSEKRSLLRSVDMFRYIDDEELAPIEDALVRRKFDRDEIIYESASDERLLTILASGVASVTVPASTGNVEVRRMVPGDAIGQSIILAGAKLNATMRAVTVAIVYQLRSDEISALLARRPEIGERMCRSLSEHRATEEKLMSVHDEKGQPSSDFFSWLKKGMKELHDLIH